MKKFWIIILTFFVLFILITLTYFVLYPIWGRRLIYPAGSKISKYSGSGHVTKQFNEMLFVKPKGEGRPKFDAPENIANYSSDLYEVIQIPAQDQLLYTVGIFEKWENIPNTLDKYLVIKNSKTKKLERHRIASEYSDLFKENITNFAIENVSISLDKNKINKVVNRKTVPVLKTRDVVIVVPIFDPPELAKKDEIGNLLASWIIIRRVGGKL